MNCVVFIISNGDVVWGVLAGFSTHKYVSGRIICIGMGLKPHSTIRFESEGV